MAIRHLTRREAIRKSPRLRRAAKPEERFTEDVISTVVRPPAEFLAGSLAGTAGEIPDISVESQRSLEERSPDLAERLAASRRWQTIATQDRRPPLSGFAERTTNPTVRETLGADTANKDIPGTTEWWGRWMQEKVGVNPDSVAFRLGTFFSPGGIKDLGVGIAGTFAGRKAAQRRSQRLLEQGVKREETPIGRRDAAVKMKADEVSDDEIFNQTGWLLDPRDNQWKFFVDHTKMKIKWDKIPSEGTDLNLDLGELVDFPELFELYPELTSVRVRWNRLDKSRPLSGEARTTQRKDTGEVVRELDANAQATDMSLGQVISHEIEHFIQDIERFAPGGGVVPRAPTAAGELEDFYKRYSRSAKELATAKYEMDLLNEVRKVPDVETLDTADVLTHLRQNSTLNIPDESLTELRIFHDMVQRASQNPKDRAALERLVNTFQLTTDIMSQRVAFLDSINSTLLEKGTANVTDKANEVVNAFFNNYLNLGGEINARLAQYQWRNFTSTGKRPIGEHPLRTRERMLAEENLREARLAEQRGVTPRGVGGEQTRDVDILSPRISPTARGSTGASTRRYIEQQNAANENLRELEQLRRARQEVRRAAMEERGGE